MTAEIAICNANGIALAADSAVTMGDGQKIYNSANKLFSLSKHHPVAIMVYNSGSLLRVPWETIIKQYRDYLGQGEFNTLSEYGDDFWRFINSKTTWFPQKDIDAFISSKVEKLLTEIRTEFIDAVSDPSFDSDDEALLRTALSSIIDKYDEICRNLDFVTDFDEADIEEILATNLELFNQLSTNILENSFAILTRGQKDKLNQVLSSSLTKNHFDHYSGVVITGFGSDEIHPKVASYNAGIFANGKLRKNLDLNLSNTHHDEFIPQIFPYAQDDVVRSFIQGVNPEIDKYIKTLISGIDSLAAQIPNDALSGDTEDQWEASKELIRTTIRGYTDGLIQNYDEAKYALGTSELLSMLTVLPKDELAEMAEALVNLTAFKRRMTAAQESVGGPIDVAILSKGDGFIWIKRKHYFKPELNQNFFHNYFSE